jgi:hypothetical protein
MGVATFRGHLKGHTLNFNVPLSQYILAQCASVDIN